MTTLRIGTRASALALAQSGQLGAAVARHLGAEVELVHVSTYGDLDRTSPLAEIGGTGVFVTAVRRALVAGEVDAVVHSAKDLPTLPADGITIACMPAREDMRDALCARDGLTLDTLPAGARVGTGSPRRAAQLLRARPNLSVVSIRGNVDTRLARALGADADLDAVVLAAAGLRRLGRDDAVSELLDPGVMLPAPAQGALALECRTADAGSDLARAAAAEDDPATRAAVTAERALLRALEAGCSAPVGALGQVADGRLTLRGLVIAPDGQRAYEDSLTVPLDLSADRETLTAIAADLGSRLAATLLDQGAATVLGSTVLGSTVGGSTGRGA